MDKSIFEDNYLKYKKISNKRMIIFFTIFLLLMGAPLPFIEKFNGQLYFEKIMYLSIWFSIMIISIIYSLWSNSILRKKFGLCCPNCKEYLCYNNFQNISEDGICLKCDYEVYID